MLLTKQLIQIWKYILFICFITKASWGEGGGWNLLAPTHHDIMQNGFIIALFDKPCILGVLLFFFLDFGSSKDKAGL